MSQSMLRGTSTWVSTSWFEHTWESKRSAEHPLHLALLSNDCEHEFSMKWNSHAAVVIMLKLDESIRCSLELGCIWIFTYVLVYWLIVWLKRFSTAQRETKADDQVYIKCRHTQKQYVDFFCQIKMYTISYIMTVLNLDVYICHLAIQSS